MTAVPRFLVFIALLPVFALPGAVLSQQAEADAKTQPGQPGKTAESGPKTIDRQELKRLIAEKLAAKADPELIKLLLDQARAGEKRSLDPLADRESFETLLGEMEEMREITAKVRKDTVGDLVDQSPTEPIELIVNQTVRLLKARLGGESEGTLENPKERIGHPIPEYADAPLLMEKVNELLKNQANLRKQLVKDPSERDAAETNEALAGMILAQEELAWEAAWPYTEAEVKGIGQAGGAVSRDVYLGRLKRGIGAVNAELTRERTSVGRERTARQFVLYLPADEEALKRIDGRLLDLRGHADAWRELAVPFDAETEKLFSVPEGRSD